MNIALWVVQIILAIFFVIHGYTLLTTKTEVRQPQMAYMLAMPVWLRQVVGVAEILAGVGLVLGWITGILPLLTPLAAAGLMVLMIGAIIFHIPRKEYGNIVFNLVLLALAAFVAYGRWVLVPMS